MFWTRKNKNINPHLEQTAKKDEWLGLELLSLLEKPNKTIITARLVGKPTEYLNKLVNYRGRKYRIVGVEWGASNKIVGLTVL